MSQAAQEANGQGTWRDTERRVRQDHASFQHFAANGSLPRPPSPAALCWRDARSTIPPEPVRHPRFHQLPHHVASLRIGLCSEAVEPFVLGGLLTKVTTINQLFEIIRNPATYPPDERWLPPFSRKRIVGADADGKAQLGGRGLRDRPVTSVRDVLNLTAWPIVSARASRGPAGGPSIFDWRVCWARVS